jgi:hypothetical protein
MKKYSTNGIYQLIKENGGEMSLSEIYEAIEYSGELSDHDRDINSSKQIRYKHNIRGYLQDLKDKKNMLTNPRTGVWKILGSKTEGRNVQTKIVKNRGKRTTHTPPSQTGAGFGVSADANKEVEKAAISFVIKDYESKHWRVRSVESEKCGFDLVCRRGSTEENVEVKGIKGEKMSFIITAAEASQAKINDKFVLCIVLSAVSNPKLYRFKGESFLKKFDLKPVSFIATLEKQ